MRNVFFVILLLAVFSANAQRAAVLEFKAGVGVSQADVDGISAIFITYFRPAGYTMVERTQIDKIIDEQGFQRSSMTESQMVRIGQILNVSKIVIGDVNVVMGQYNVDARVLSVETGTIAATEGATFSEASYRVSMQSIAQKLAAKIAIPAAPSVSTSTSPVNAKERTDVEMIYGYLKVFPKELGYFDAEPTTVISHINLAVQCGYNTWRIPTNEELSLLRANGYLNENRTYMTQENRTGVVLLVTDKDDAATLAEQRRQQQIEVAHRVKELLRAKEQRKAELLAQGWVDLGLPSGTLWKDENEDDDYTYHQAIMKYRNQLPNPHQVIELTEKCSWEWSDERSGYVVTGRNGNSIFLPAPAPRLNSLGVGDPGYGGHGHYVTTYAKKARNGNTLYYLLYFSERFIDTALYDISDGYRHMVRLVHQ